MEDYVSFEQAKALKELGFDWEVTPYYLINAIGDLILWFPEEAGGCDFNFFDDGRFSAPTLAQTAKWLREKGYHIQITPNMTWRGWRILLYIKIGSPEICDSYEGYKFDSYEKALSAGIDLALKYLKEKKA